jgi:hypothetical protein
MQHGGDARALPPLFPDRCEPNVQGHCLRPGMDYYPSNMDTAIDIQGLTLQFGPVTAVDHDCKQEKLRFRERLAN